LSQRGERRASLSRGIHKSGELALGGGHRDGESDGAAEASLVAESGRARDRLAVKSRAALQNGFWKSR